jgi:hypothetical protein
MGWPGRVTTLLRIAFTGYGRETKGRVIQAEIGKMILKEFCQEKGAKPLTS